MLQKKSGEFLPHQPLTDDVEIILTDFGLVRIAHATTHTAVGTVSGTPAYMSPEQARGDTTDHRTDIYSLGIVLYEMLAGRVPFEADSQLSVIYMHINNPPPPIPGISEALQAIIDRALAKDPNDRYQSSGEMAAEFSRVIKKEPKTEEVVKTQAVEVIPGNGAAPPVQKQNHVRSRAWLGAGIFSFVCLLALGAGAWGMASYLPSLSRPTPTVPATPTTSLPTVQVPVTGSLPAADGMVQVAADRYEVGLSPADEYHSVPQQVELGEFWIDQFQVSNAQYAIFVEETGAPAPEVWPGEEEHPVRGVSWEQAVAYCSWLNKRLPTEAEWEAAGRGTGPEPRLYPWGNDPTASGQTSGLPDEDTYAIGTMSFNESPFGVFDMLGNVWEWVGEPYTSSEQGIRFMHGGRYGLPIVDLAYRLGIAPGDTRYIKYAGFRCAADEVR
jgi:formylglycine-generating enzyme required for sulfatase activity